MAKFVEQEEELFWLRTVLQSQSRSLVSVLERCHLFVRRAQRRTMTNQHKNRSYLGLAYHTGFKAQPILIRGKRDPRNVLRT